MGNESEWVVDWDACKQLLKISLTCQVIREQFGVVGLRIFNFLREGQPPQKLEDNDIFSVCMVNPDQGREILNAMTCQCLISLQEVPRGLNIPSFWLYYVDPKRAEMAVLQSIYQAILNLRIRFRVESAKVAPLEKQCQ